MKPDHSCGTIPVFLRDTETLYLVVKHASGHWAFPKGHREEGEDDIDAALRELAEETGIELPRSALLPAVLTERYTFMREGVEYDKTADYRIGQIPSMELAIDQKEIIDYAWLPFDQAFERITFPESKQVLRQAQALLETFGSRGQG